MIPVDAQGNALSNAVVWLDSRAGEQAEEIAAVISPEALYEQTGVTDLGGALPLCSFFLLTRYYVCAIFLSRLF